MATFYPVLITVAIFIALILDDIIQRTPENIPTNTLQGFVSMILMLILSFKDMELVSWGLLVLPIIVLILCYYYAIKVSVGNPTAILPGATTVASTAQPVMSCSTAATGSPSNISVPSSPTMSAQIQAAPYTFTPITACSPR